MSLGCIDSIVFIVASSIFPVGSSKAFRYEFHSTSLIYTETVQYQKRGYEINIFLCNIRTLPFKNAKILFNIPNAHSIVLRVFLAVKSQTSRSEVASNLAFRKDFIKNDWKLNTQLHTRWDFMETHLFDTKERLFPIHQPDGKYFTKLNAEKALLFYFPNRPSSTYKILWLADHTANKNNDGISFSAPVLMVLIFWPSQPANVCNINNPDASWHTGQLFPAVHNLYECVKTAENVSSVCEVIYDQRTLNFSRIVDTRKCRCPAQRPLSKWMPLRHIS